MKFHGKITVFSEYIYFLVGLLEYNLPLCYLKIVSFHVSYWNSCVCTDYDLLINWCQIPVDSHFHS